MLERYDNVDTINKNILLSEDHELTPSNVKCINQATTYLQTLVNDENAGLLAHELFFTVNGKVRGKSCHDYSTYKRCCEWNGIVHEFEDPKTIEHTMQLMMDDFNNKFWKYKQQKRFNQSYIALLLSKLSIDYLRIHPFGDGNGRTIKCILNYILLSLHFQTMDFSNIPYMEWCKIIYEHNYNVLQTLYVELIFIR